MAGSPPRSAPSTSSPAELSPQQRYALLIVLKKHLLQKLRDIREVENFVEPYRKIEERLARIELGLPAGPPAGTNTTTSNGLIHKNYPLEGKTSNLLDATSFHKMVYDVASGDKMKSAVDAQRLPTPIKHVPPITMLRRKLAFDYDGRGKEVAERILTKHLKIKREKMPAGKEKLAYDTLCALYKHNDALAKTPADFVAFYHEFEVRRRRRENNNGQNKKNKKGKKKKGKSDNSNSNSNSNNNNNNNNMKQPIVAAKQPIVAAKQPIVARANVCPNLLDMVQRMRKYALPSSPRLESANSTSSGNKPGNKPGKCQQAAQNAFGAQAPLTAITSPYLFQRSISRVPDRPKECIAQDIVTCLTEFLQHTPKPPQSKPIRPSPAHQVATFAERIRSTCKHLSWVKEPNSTQLFDKWKESNWVKQERATGVVWLQTQRATSSAMPEFWYQLYRNGKAQPLIYDPKNQGQLVPVVTNALERALETSRDDVSTWKSFTLVTDNANPRMTELRMTELTKMSQRCIIPARTKTANNINNIRKLQEVNHSFPVLRDRIRRRNQRLQEEIRRRLKAKSDPNNLEQTKKSFENYLKTKLLSKNDSEIEYRELIHRASAVARQSQHDSTIASTCAGKFFNEPILRLNVRKPDGIMGTQAEKAIIAKRGVLRDIINNAHHDVNTSIEYTKDMLKKYVTFLRRHNIITPKTLEDLKNACISEKTNSSNPLPPWMGTTYEQYTKDITKIMDTSNGGNRGNNSNSALSNKKGGNGGNGSLPMSSVPSLGPSLGPNNLDDYF